jgi:hypothetical protein
MPHRKVLITQSNYIPWKGWFDGANLADDLILYDHVQYTRRDWRNRNVIKTAAGLQWLTIAVKVKGRYTQRIDETLIADEAWAEQHWRRILHAYRKAACFDQVADQVKAAYEAPGGERLSDVNRRFIELVFSLLGISTRIHWSTDFDLVEGRTENLVSLCRQVGAGVYYTGPAASAYLEPEQFAREGIELRYLSYSDYPAYRQLHGPFVHQVSVLDMLFNLGRDAPRYLRSFATSEASAAPGLGAGAQGEADADPPPPGST